MGELRELLTIMTVHPPPILETMYKCLGLQLLLDECKKLDFMVEEYGVDSLDMVIEASLLEDKDSLQSQYLVFKQRALDLLVVDGVDFGQLHGKNKHILWETHKCTSECDVRRYAQCQFVFGRHDPYFCHVCL